MPFKYRLKALYFLHRQMKKVIPKLNFAESISHMCQGLQLGLPVSQALLPGMEMRFRRHLAH